jgi:hypothetical protein
VKSLWKKVAGRLLKLMRRAREEQAPPPPPKKHRYAYGIKRPRG